MSFEIGDHVRVKGDDEVLEVVALFDDMLVGVVGVPRDAKHAPVALLADRLEPVA